MQSNRSCPSLVRQRSLSHFQACFAFLTATPDVRKAAPFEDEREFEEKDDRSVDLRTEDKVQQKENSKN
jgi:hypothetical protein